MAQYLPVLLVSVSAISAANPAPDDSSLDTQAIGQVDYLSHNWQEEDVAKSWRNMTRRKDSIQNGARLENASWRTWWKQRNKLPTVSPETLNWLKDSDVTWLYGPLHTAADWAPPPRQTPSPERESLSPPPSADSSALSPPSLHPNDARRRAPTSRSNSPWALKPILKHRSISELLSFSFHSSPSVDSMDLGEDPEDFASSAATSGNLPTLRTRGSHDMNQSEEVRKRPKLKHTKSDTNVHRRNPFRGDSPPLPLAPDGKSPGTLSSALRSPSTRSRDSSCGETNSYQKRHISFNTFVEQCIAIEKPETSRSGRFVYEDDFDITEEIVEDRDYEEESDNEYGSEDDVLEMRPSSHLRTYSRRTPSLSGTPSSNGFDMSATGSEREHITIAPIAPTMLKTSASPSPVRAFYHGGYGSIWEDDDDEEEEMLFASKRSHAMSSYSDTDRSDTVNLVYVPPQGSVYAERLSANGMGANMHMIDSGSMKASGKRLSSPPPEIAQLHSESFDDAELFEAKPRDEDEFDPSSKSGFDLFTGSEMGGVQDPLHRSGATPRNGRSPGQTRYPSASDLASRDGLSVELEDSRSGHSKGSSSSVSEDGTVMPPSVPFPSSPRTAALRGQRETSSPSPVPGSSHINLPSQSLNSSASLPIPIHGHVHQIPSPAPSSTSTGTTSSTTSGGSANSVGSYGSPFLEPPSRGRSISPNTSASASTSGDSVRGRSIRRTSSNSLSDVYYAGRDKEDRETQRGRSRSRSIGTVDGSVSPRSGSRNRLSRRASIDCGSVGLPGLGAYGLSASPTWRGQSLSPEDEDGIRKAGRVKSRLRSDKGRDYSVSPPNNGKGEKPIVVIEDSPPTAPRSISDSAEMSQTDTVHHIIVEDTDASLNIPKSALPSLPSPNSAPVDSTTPQPAVNNSFTPSPMIIHIRSPSEESSTLVGRAMSSAKGYLGALWGGQGTSDASNTSGSTDR